MRMNDLVWKPIVELVGLIASRSVSPVDVVRAYLERIEALDGRLKAYITVCRGEALAAAEAAEAAVMSGHALGALHGIPIGAKDLYQTKGIRTTAGSKILSGWVPEEDATVVTRLREAGCIVLGKLNMHEFAYGPEGINVHHGTAWNPWDAATHRIAGGSSSGSGVGVAAALCAGALGSDTGGSIRIPSALCGVFGIKPTYGRVSRAGVIPLSWSLDHVGPMTRTAQDAALLLGVMAGYDPKDPSSRVLPVPDYAAALSGRVSGLRIGLLRRSFLDAADRPVSRAVEEAVSALEDIGAEAEEVELRTAVHAAGASFAILSSEALAYHEEWMRSRPGDYAADVMERLRTGAFIPATAYVKGQQARALIREEVDDLLAAHDVLIAPTTPMAATPFGENVVELNGREQEVRASLTSFTRIFNLTGHPVASVPCGFTAEGLPIGMQIIGRPFDEATVLRVAAAYQRITDWHTRRPPAA
jgi:aspartyl-tRNA(Asn)/glutamyl-tRNA(Gln) amidotransferase subunit A